MDNELMRPCEAEARFSAARAGSPSPEEGVTDWAPALAEEEDAPAPASAPLGALFWASRGSPIGLRRAEDAEEKRTSKSSATNWPSQSSCSPEMSRYAGLC